MGLAGTVVDAGRILHSKRRQDYFSCPREWEPFLDGAPAVYPIGADRIELHRSLLPILAQNVPEVMRFWNALPRTFNRDVGDFYQHLEMRGVALRGYQREGREWVMARRGALIADQMRLGKTVTAATTHDPSRGPLVVVGPLAVREVWLQWMKRLWPDVEPFVMEGERVSQDDREALKRAPLVLGHYDILAYWQGLGWRYRIGTLILDECHLLSNKRTLRTQAVGFLTAISERVVALSGTPLWNRPPGLWSILMAVAPGAWGSWKTFADRYGNPQLGTHGTVYKGVSNAEEFKARLSEVMLRRTWQDVRSELPPVTRTVELRPLTPKEFARIEGAVESVRKEGTRVTGIGELARLRKLLGEFKVDLAVSLAEQVLDGEEPVVVWTWHKSVADSIVKALRKRKRAVFLVTGRENENARIEARKAWRASPTPAALVMTMAVGQTGLDLSHARQAIFAEVDYLPLTVAQAEMRTYSPERPSAITYAMTDHPVDRQITETLMEKCAIAEKLGVPTAETAIDVMAKIFSPDTQPVNMDAFVEALLRADAPDEGD